MEDNKNGVVRYYGINENSTKNNKKYKLKKRKQKILSIGLALILTLSTSKIISNYKNNSNKTKGINQTYVDSESIATIRSGDDEYKEVDSLEPIYTSLTTSQLNEINNYINNNNVEYKYSDFYNLDNNLSKYYSEKKINSNKGEVLLDSNGNIDTNKLYNLVIENNKKYMSNKNVETCFYREFDNSKIKEICDSLCEIINDESNKQQINFTGLCNNLTDLKMFINSSTASNAYFTENLCLVLNPTMIEVFHSIDKKQNTEYNTLVHEIIHLIQYSSSDMNKENGIEVGICRKYEDGVDSLYWSWLLEASAEKNMSLYTGSQTTTYGYQIGYMESISMANVLSDNFNVMDTEKLCFSNNLNDLFKLFEANTEAEKRNILNMMFSIEIIESNPQSFFEEYYNKTGIDLKNDSEARENLKHELRCEVLLTLNNYFYKNLSNKIYKGKVSLQDVFYLLNIWESDIQSHLLIDQNNRMDRSTYFLNSYTELQEKLFNYIAINKSCSIDDIYELYNAYSTRVSCNGVKKEPNCDLKFLTDQKKNYIHVQKSRVYKTGYVNLTDLKTGIKNIKNSY